MSFTPQLAGQRQTDPGHGNKENWFRLRDRVVREGVCTLCYRHSLRIEIRDIHPTHSLDNKE